MFNEGQTVWCLIYGQGVVTDVASKRTEETYPVFVKISELRRASQLHHGRKIP